MTEEIDPIAHVRNLPIPEQIKYAFARYCWVHADELCKVNGSTMSWADRFKQCYKQSLDSYILECRRRFNK